MIRPPPISTLFPYTTLFRSAVIRVVVAVIGIVAIIVIVLIGIVDERSEEHTSELQSRRDLVCRLLLEKKNSRRRYGAYNSSNTPSRLPLTKHECCMGLNSKL